MKILMVLSKPFITDSRVRKESLSLVNEGHKVSIIVWDRNNQYAEQERVDNVDVIRIQNKGFLRVLPGVLIKNPLWWLKAFVRGLKCDFDVVHCHDLDTLPIGILLKKKTKCKLVYDAHEIFAYMVEKKVPSFVYNQIFNMEKKLVKYVDRIITVNRILEVYFRSICNKHITVVMNCSIPITSYQKPKDNTFTICYIGSLNTNRMFPKLIDIIGNIKNVNLIVAGKKEGIYDQVKERSKLYQNIKFLGTIPDKEIYSKMIESNVLISMLTPNDKNDQVSTPIKVFDAMAVGRPIIVTKGMYYSKFVERNECGISAEYNTSSITKVINDLQNNIEKQKELGMNGLQMAFNQYNWKKQEEKLLNLYENI